MIQRIGVNVAKLVLLISAAMMITLGFLMDRHPVSLVQLAKVKVGDSAEQVKSTLGKPSSVNVEKDATIWVYSRMKWCIVNVHFDADHGVTKVEHDH
jgi:outer membrane protein assembly factor BamE (lipoprotein component of BamABCDE complex)